MVNFPIGLTGTEPDADWYDRDNRKNVGHFDDDWKHDTLINAVKGVSVLEIGCNEGKLLRRLKQMDYECFGTDISPFIIDLAKEKSTGIEYKVSNAYNVPWERKFHTIIASDLIEHLEDPVKALRAWNSALHPLGRLVVFTPNAFAHTKLIKASKGEDIVEPRAHINMMSIWSLGKHIHDAGMVVKHMSGITEEFITCIAEKQ